MNIFHNFCLTFLGGLVDSPPKHFGDVVFSHEWFIIHLQRDEVELEMNSEPQV